MDLFAIIAAFGGGIIGAYMGALPAFIMTGVAAAIGGLMGMGGADPNAAVNIFAFGTYFGPHIAFAGGVAASAYAGRKKKLAAGNDITTCLNGLAAPDVLIVGGVFGLFGYVLHNLIAPNLGTAGIVIDPGLTVWISGIVARLVFGKTGLLGKYEGDKPRVWFSTGNGFACNLVLGAGLGIAVAFIGKVLADAGVALDLFHVVVFGFAAISLIFAQMGGACPGTHHIVLPAALATAHSGSIIVGIIFGILGSLIGDFAGNAFNSHCDSHIDPPAFTIWTLTIVICLIWPNVVTAVNWM